MADSTVPPEIEPVDAAPPDEEFWETYSPNFEFPLSSVGSVALHIGAVVLLIFIVNIIVGKSDTPAVPMRAVVVVADGDVGDGRAGSGGGTDKKEDIAKEEDFTPSPPVPETELIKIREQVQTWIPDSKLSKEQIEAISVSPNIKQLEKLNDKFRKQLLEGRGDKKGQGQAEGNATGNEKEGGNKGTGNAATTAGRELRWTLNFSTASGADYLQQLKTMKASVVFPRNNGTAILIKDLAKPNDQTKITELSEMTGMSFVDDRRESVIGVAASLSLPFTPDVLIAFFPKEIEDQLASLERGHRGRKEEDIITTTFKIIVRDGKYEIKVQDQKARR